jgi:hypothetical protein
MDGRGLDSSAPGQEEMTYNCEHDNETPGFIKCVKFLEKQKTY